MTQNYYKHNHFISFDDTYNCKPKEIMLQFEKDHKIYMATLEDIIKISDEKYNKIKLEIKQESK